MREKILNLKSKILPWIDHNALQIQDGGAIVE